MKISPLLVVFLVGSFIFPFFTFAQAELVDVPPQNESEIIPCGFDTNNDKKVSGEESCRFWHLIVLAQNVINFLIFRIAAPLAAVMFAYAGFLYVTNMGNESKIKQAHDIFLYVFIGFVVCLAAWLVVYFIVNFFLDPSFIFLAAPSS